LDELQHARNLRICTPARGCRWPGARPRRWGWPVGAARPTCGAPLAFCPRPACPV